MVLCDWNETLPVLFLLIHRVSKSSTLHITVVKYIYDWLPCTPTRIWFAVAQVQQLARMRVPCQCQMRRQKRLRHRQPANKERLRRTTLPSLCLPRSPLSLSAHSSLAYCSCTDSFPLPVVPTPCDLAWCTMTSSPDLVMKEVPCDVTRWYCVTGTTLTCIVLLIFIY